MAWYQQEEVLRQGEHEETYTTEAQMRSDGARAAQYGWVFYLEREVKHQHVVTYKHFSD